MKKLTTVVSVMLVLSFAISATADSIVIDASSNARTSANFYGRRNLRFVLAPRTHGKILKKKIFRSGDIAYQIQIEDGPRRGAVVWVLHKQGHHNLDVLNDQGHPVDDLAQARRLVTRRRVAAFSHAPANDAQLAQGNQIDELVQSSQTREGTDDQIQELVLQAERREEPIQLDTTAALNASAVTAGQVNSDVTQSVSSDASSCGAQVAVISPPPPPPVQPDYQDHCKDQSGQDRQGKSFVNPHVAADDSAIDPAIAAQAQAIIQQSGATTDLEKAQAIHDWVAANISYNPDANQAWLNGAYDQGAMYFPSSAIDTFNSKKGICMGYSNLYSAMARSVGLQVKLVYGRVCTVNGQDASKNEWQDHAWDEVMVDGNWIQVDATWDHDFFDPSPAKAYLHPLQHQYFNHPFPADLSQNHQMPSQ